MWEGRGFRHGDTDIILERTLRLLSRSTSFVMSTELVKSRRNAENPGFLVPVTFGLGHFGQVGLVQVLHLVAKEDLTPPRYAPSTAYRNGFSAPAAHNFFGQCVLTLSRLSLQIGGTETDSEGLKTDPPSRGTLVLST